MDGAQLGNRNISCAREPLRKTWVFTWHNYGLDGKVIIMSILKADAKRWIIGMENGKSGETPHIQGYVEFKKDTRPNEKYGKIGIWWNKAKGSALENRKYCSKEGDFHEFNMPREIETYRPQHEYFDLIEGLLDEKPDNRKIYWFIDYFGGVGKSAFSKYMYCKYGDVVSVITSGKSNDILTCVTGEERMFILDFPRCQGSLYCPFNAIEQLKNGFITDAKLKKKAKIIAMNIPHVIVFTNHMPELEKLSEDRWEIFYFNTISDMLQIPYTDTGGRSCGPHMEHKHPLPTPLPHTD